MEVDMRRVKSESRLRMLLAGLSLSLLPLVGGCASPDADGATAADATLYEGARILVGDGSAPIENGAFLVENGRFTRVGRGGELALPTGAARVDLTGKTVMPALINTHVHLGVAREDLANQLQHFAYYGVGTVQSMGLDSGSVTLDMRGESVPGGARYLTAYQGITSPEPGRGEVPHWVTTEEEARAAVRDLAAKQVGLIKIWVDDRGGQYERLSPALYGAVIDEAHRNGQRVAAHLYALEDAKGLIRAGVDAFAHSVRDTDIDAEGLAMIRERTGFLQIPNLPDRGVATDLSWIAGTIPAEQLAGLQSRSTDRPEVQERFAVQGRNLVLLQEAGVRIGMGTDGGVPWAAHVELEDMVGAGMTPAQVITAATRNSAEFLQLPDVGTIATGKTADFLVLDGNPLDDITNTRRIDAVYLRGAAVDRAAISARQLGASEGP